MAEGGTNAAAWIALAGTALGVVVGFLGQFLTAKSASTRERESREQARRDAAKLRQNEFQRETLLRLQDIASELFKTANAMDTHCRGIEETTGEWATGYPDRLLDLIEQGFLDMQRLGNRVLEDSARKHALKLADDFNGVFQARSEERFHEAFDCFSRAYQEFTVKAGETLRGLEADFVSL